MATDLFPTPTRLALLYEIDAGEVLQMSDGESVVLDVGRDRKVTDQVAAMERAGWVKLVPLRLFGAKRWDLTDSGRAVLAANTKD